MFWDSEEGKRKEKNNVPASVSQHWRNNPNIFSYLCPMVAHSCSYSTAVNDIRLGKKTKLLKCRNYLRVRHTQENHVCPHTHTHTHLPRGRNSGIPHWSVQTCDWSQCRRCVCCPADGQLWCKVFTWFIVCGHVVQVLTVLTEKKKINIPKITWHKPLTHILYQLLTVGSLLLVSLIYCRTQ